MSTYGLQGKQVHINLKGIQTPFIHQNYGTANILAKKNVTICKQMVNHCTADSSVVFTGQVLKGLRQNTEG